NGQHQLFRANNRDCNGLRFHGPRHDAALEQLTPVHGDMKYRGAGTAHFIVNADASGESNTGAPQGIADLGVRVHTKAFFVRLSLDRDRSAVVTTPLAIAAIPFHGSPPVRHGGPYEVAHVDVPRGGL